MGGALDNPSPVDIKDEGVKIVTATEIDFVGAGVVASGAGGKASVAISGGGGGMATHSFLDEYHSFPKAAPSGNVLTAIGSGNIPTWAPSPGGIGTHNMGGAHHNPDTFANFISKVNDAVPLKAGDSVASLTSWAGHIGSIGAHIPWPIGVASITGLSGHIGSLGAHIPWPIAIGSISGLTGHIGSANAHYNHTGHAGSLSGHFAWPLPVASVSGYSSHVGSKGAHHTYPVSSGGVASGAVPLAECRGTLTATQHPNTDHRAGGMSVLYQIRTPAWFITATQSVGSMLSAHIMADGPWIALAAYAHARIAPSGGKILIDVKHDGTSQFASLPYITTGTNYSGVYSFATTGIPSGSKLQVDFMEVGSSHAGEDVTIQLVCQGPVR